MSPESTKRIRILLVDDQVLFREAIRTVLEQNPEFEIIGEAASGEEAVDKALQLSPDVVLMDLRMPNMGGVEATRRITAARSDIRILVLTTFDDDQEVLAVLRCGASGYVLKNIPTVELTTAIKSVAAGGSYLLPAIATHVVGEYRRLAHGSTSLSSEDPSARLSVREKDILRQLLQGQSNKEIASALGLTEGTVKNHMTSILLKFKAPDRTALALKARDIGFL